MTLNLTMPSKEDLKPRITVFGVGGAGGNAVNNMIEKELDGVEFVVANTDAQALQQSVAQTKIQMGVRVTEGLGAGARPSVGAAAAEETIDEIEDALQKLDKSPYSPDTKVSEEFLAPVFKKFFSALDLPNLMNKSDYHELARFVSKDDIDEEVETVLDGILEVFQNACPATEP